MFKTVCYCCHVWSTGHRIPFSFITLRYFSEEIKIKNLRVQSWQAVKIWYITAAQQPGCGKQPHKVTYTVLKMGHCIEWCGYVTYVIILEQAKKANIWCPSYLINPVWIPQGTVTLLYPSIKIISISTTITSTPLYKKIYNRMSEGRKSQELPSHYP